MQVKIVADLRGEGEGDLNIVIQGDLVHGVAELALKMGVHLFQIAKAAHHLRAESAQELPVHLKQAHSGGMDEQFDGFLLGHAPGAAILDGIDPEQIVVIGGADEGFELGNHAGLPVMGFFQLDQPLLEEILVNLGGHGESLKNGTAGRP